MTIKSSSNVLQVVPNMENYPGPDIERDVAKTLLSSGQWLIFCLQFCGYWPLSTGPSKKVNRNKLPFESFVFNSSNHCTFPIFMSFCWLSSIACAFSLFFFVTNTSNIEEISGTATGIYAVLVYIFTINILIAYLKCQSVFRRGSFCSLWKSMIRILHCSIQMGKYRNCQEFYLRISGIQKETKIMVILNSLLACVPIISTLLVFHFYDKNDQERRGYNFDPIRVGTAIWSLLNINFHFICCTPWILFLLKVDCLCCDLLENEFAGQMTNVQEKIDFYHQLESVVTEQTTLFEQNFVIDLFIGFVQVTASGYFGLHHFLLLTTKSFFLLLLPGFMVPILYVMNLFKVCSQAAMLSNKCIAIGKRIEISGFHCVEKDSKFKVIQK